MESDCVYLWGCVLILCLSQMHHTFNTERPFITDVSILVDVNRFEQTHACLQNAVSKYHFNIKENNICNEVSLMCGE